MQYLVDYDGKFLRYLADSIVAHRNRAIKLHCFFDDSITIFTLLDLIDAQHFQCAVCHIDIHDKPSLDHKFPMKHYGRNTLDNVRFVCRKCNRDKWDKILPEFAHLEDDPKNFCRMPRVCRWKKPRDWTKRTL